MPPTFALTKTVGGYLCGEGLFGDAEVHPSR